MGFKLEGYIGIFYGVFGLFVEVHLPHRALVFSLFTDQFGDGLRAVIQVGFGQHIHIMAHIGIDEIMRNHGVVDRALYLYTVFKQYLDVVFKVMANFFDLIIFKKKGKPLD